MFRQSTKFATVILVSGCASFVPPSKFSEAQRLIVADQSLNTSQKADKLSEAVNQDYREAIGNCSKVMAEMRKGFNGQRGASVGLATVGIIAGSIVVPSLAASATASKAAIAAWGGVSGATNAGQYMLDNNGLSGAQASAVYEQMRTEIKAASNAYSAETDPTKKAAAVNALILACEFQPLPAVKPLPPNEEDNQPT